MHVSDEQKKRKVKNSDDYQTNEAKIEDLKASPVPDIPSMSYFNGVSQEQNITVLEVFLIHRMEGEEDAV